MRDGGFLPSRNGLDIDNSPTIKGQTDTKLDSAACGETNNL